MPERTNPFIREGYHIETQNVRLDLYRLLSAFFASQEFANLSTGDGAYDPIGSLADEFEESEIVRTLISIATSMRIADDQNNHYLDRYNTDTGVLITDLNQPDQTVMLNLREACNKMIHATAVKFDIDENENFNEYLNPTIYLYGEKRGVRWKAVLRISDFARDVSALLP
jgi:hypothetical protein